MSAYLEGETGLTVDKHLRDKKKKHRSALALVKKVNIYDRYRLETAERQREANRRRHETNLRRREANLEESVEVGRASVTSDSLPDIENTPYHVDFVPYSKNTSDSDCGLQIDLGSDDSPDRSMEVNCSVN